MIHKNTMLLRKMVLNFLSIKERSLKNAARVRSSRKISIKFRGASCLFKVAVYSEAKGGEDGGNDLIWYDNKGVLLNVARVRRRRRVPVGISVSVDWIGTRGSYW